MVCQEAMIDRAIDASHENLISQGRGLQALQVICARNTCSVSRSKDSDDGVANKHQVLMSEKFRFFLLGFMEVICEALVVQVPKGPVVKGTLLSRACEGRGQCFKR